MQRKNRLLLSSVSALIAAVVATGSINPAPAVGQPYRARPPTPQGLTFSGHVEGKLTAATTNCYLFKDRHEFTARLSGLIGGRLMEVTIYTPSGYNGYKGAGEYAIGGSSESTNYANVLIDFDHEQYVAATASGAGKLTINADEKSGTMEADVAGHPDSEYVTGNWICHEVTVY
jgi:hypothetical protein